MRNQSSAAPHQLTLAIESFALLLPDLRDAWGVLLHPAVLSRGRIPGLDNNLAHHQSWAGPTGPHPFTS